MQEPNIYGVVPKPSSVERKLSSIDDNVKAQLSELKQQTENQQIQIAELKESNSKLQKQSAFNKQEASSAKKEGKKATLIGVIGIVIAIASFAFEIVSRFLI